MFYSLKHTLGLTTALDADALKEMPTTLNCG